MNGYLLALGLLACVLIPSCVEGGCAARGKCCKGKDNTCKALGPRLNGKQSKFCFCDEECVKLGDCCTDFKEACPEQECLVGNWEKYGECSSSCGTGVKSRTRPVIQEPRNGGTPCGTIEEKTFCFSTQKCKVARHSNGHMEVRETGNIIPAEYGTWRASKLFDPYKDIRRNLFRHYNANDIIRRPSYCATFEITKVKDSCFADPSNPWGSQLREGNQVCIECQPFAMKKNLGVRCQGHGVFMRESRFNEVNTPGCHGKWVMRTRHEDCSCPVGKPNSFILV